MHRTKSPEHQRRVAKIGHESPRVLRIPLADAVADDRLGAVREGEEHILIADARAVLGCDLALLFADEGPRFVQFDPRPTS